MNNFIITQWVLIAAALVVIGMSIYVMWSFSSKPREDQLVQLREWLLWAVTLAERELGGGTGQLKIRYVYDMFVERFPWLAKMIDFNQFSDLVDGALDQMHGMISTNKAIKAIVEGDAV